MTILLVDDDDGIIKVWQSQLNPLGATLLVAHTLEQAFEQMSRIPPPDLVLLDLVLPPHTAKDTAAAVETLRQFNPELVVVAISGMAHDDIVRALAGAKVEEVISKQDANTQEALLRVIQSAWSKAGMKSAELLDLINKFITERTPQ